MLYSIQAGVAGAVDKLRANFVEASCFPLMSMINLVFARTVGRCVMADVYSSAAAADMQTESIEKSRETMTWRSRRRRTFLETQVETLKST